MISNLVSFSFHMRGDEGQVGVDEFSNIFQKTRESPAGGDAPGGFVVKDFGNELNYYLGVSFNDQLMIPLLNRYF